MKKFQKPLMAQKNGDNGTKHRKKKFVNGKNSLTDFEKKRQHLKSSKLVKTLFFYKLNAFLG